MSELDGSTCSPPPAEQAWLDAERLPEDERLDRLAGDAALVAALRESGFTGPDYDYVQDEFIRYGVAVLDGWMRRGSIASMCAQKRLRGVPPAVERHFDYDTALELAGESVARAVDPFREKILLRGKWDPRRGAAIKTFFVGQCLIQFIDVAQAWVRHELPIFERDVELQPEQDLTERARAVEDDVIRDRMAHTALAAVSRPEARRALVMQAMGFTVPDIARDLEMTVKAVERMLEYAKQTARRTA
jgi:hypothetical protein